MAAASIVIGLLMSQMFNNQNLPQAQTSVNEQSVKTAVNVDGTVMTSMCMSIAGDDVGANANDTNWSLSLGAIEFIVSEWALVISGWMVWEQNSPFSGKVSLAIGALALVIGVCANIFHSKMLSFIGLVVSIFGLALDGIEALLEKLHGTLNILPTLISGAADLIATGVSAYVYMRS